MTISVGTPPSRETDVASVQVEARDSPQNRGAMCRKGFTSGQLLLAKDRLRSPLVRTSGGLKSASFDAALDFVAERFQSLSAEFGPDAVALFGGGGLTNETAYMLGKFARAVLGTRNIDYNGRFCMAAAAVALQRSVGLDRGLPFPLEDLSKADLVLLIGGNPAETMPPLMQYFDQQRERGGRLVLVDPRRTPTADYASSFIAVAPGSDLALANGLLHILVRDHLVDERFIRERTTGFEEVRRTVKTYWPDRVERITGVASQQIEALAHDLAQAKRLCVLSARGAEQQSQGVETVQAFINLTLALGQFSGDGCGYGTLTGQGNGQGGREHGQKSDQLPGYRKLSDPGHRRIVAEHWGISEADLPLAGPSAVELLDSLGAPMGPKALLVMGSNPVVSAPGVTGVEQRLRELDLLVVADSFMSETAQLADVVFPVCHWAEHAGTTTNLEGRVLLRRRALAPPFGVVTDLEILAGLAQRLGKAKLICAQPAEAFAELARVTAGSLADYSGLSHARLAEDESLQWPCGELTQSGTKRPFESTFPMPGGRARFFAVEHQPTRECVNDVYPYTLTTGRLLVHYQTGTQTHRVPELETAEPEARVYLHPQTAATLGVAENEWVIVASRRGEIRLRAQHTERIRLDTVFIPFHWGGEACVNRLTSRVLDPLSKIPEFKVTAVALRLADSVSEAPLVPEQDFDAIVH